MRSSSLSPKPPLYDLKKPCWPIVDVLNFSDRGALGCAGVRPTRVLNIYELLLAESAYRVHHLRSSEDALLYSILCVWWIIVIHYDEWLWIERRERWWWKICSSPICCEEIFALVCNQLSCKTTELCYSVPCKSLFHFLLLASLWSRLDEFIAGSRRCEV